MSGIDFEIAFWERAADEAATGTGIGGGLGGVDHFAFAEPDFAGGARARAAAVFEMQALAFGEFEDAGFAAVPLHGLFGFAEDDLRGGGDAFWEALVLEGGGTEGFEVDVLLGDAPIDEAVVARL